MDTAALKTRFFRYESSFNRKVTPQLEERATERQPVTLVSRRHAFVSGQKWKTFHF